MPTRREFLRTAALCALAPDVRAAKSEIWVNDVHSQLNQTRVRALLTPRTEEELIDAVRSSARQGTSIAVSGCRHSMGGQQFLSDGICIDTRKLNRVVRFDRERGLLEIEAGMQWPALLQSYLDAQRDSKKQWGIAQKQTGADSFTLGGSLSSNVHGRGLTMKPFIADVEAFTLVNAEGSLVRCSRQENEELFRTAIGGYGLLGIISTVILRLVPRQKLRRVVELMEAKEMPDQFAERIKKGFVYGDFQFSVDEKSADFMNRGVFSCYEPAGDDVEIAAAKTLRDDDWLDLLGLAYTDRAHAFQRYADFYLSTNNQTYWSDTHQLSAYLPNYAEKLRPRIGGANSSSLIITEIYVPRPRLVDFLAEAAGLMKEGKTPIIYGTVRLIEKDEESLLAWARQPYACIIFNLLTAHTPEGKENSKKAFCALIDLAAARGGSFYLTYHRFATRQQVTAAYPQFSRFLDLKKQYDPQERFQSDWYRHYAKLFA